MKWPFKLRTGPSKLSEFEEAHIYRLDLDKYRRDRQEALQMNMLQPSKQNAERLARIDTIIDNMQRVVVRLTESKKQAK